jgi:hypothetical protein
MAAGASQSCERRPRLLAQKSSSGGKWTCNGVTVKLKYYLNWTVTRLHVHSVELNRM